MPGSCRSRWRPGQNITASLTLEKPLRACARVVRPPIDSRNVARDASAVRSYIKLNEAAAMAGYGRIVTPNGH